MPPAVCANSSAKSSSSRISISAMTSMRERRRFRSRRRVLFVEAAHDDHDDGRYHCRHGRGVEELFRAPLPPDQDAADVGTHDCADTAEAQTGADAHRSQIRWKVGRGKRIEPGLTTYDTPTRDEHDNAEQHERDARLTDERNADDGDGEARNQHGNEPAARDDPGETEC